jgi:hypothetical protein
VSCKAQHLPNALHGDYHGMMMIDQWQISFMQHPHELLVCYLHDHAFVAKMLGITTKAVADCLCATQVA